MRTIPFSNLLAKLSEYGNEFSAGLFIILLILPLFGLLYFGKSIWSALQRGYLNWNTMSAACYLRSWIFNGKHDTTPGRAEG
jgi:hypothetical protein